jgi:hypothetical protein
MLFFVDKAHQELIMIQDVWILFHPLIEVTVGHHLEEEAHYCSHKLRCFWVTLTDLHWVEFFLNLVDDMHFEVHKFSIN